MNNKRKLAVGLLICWAFGSIGLMACAMSSTYQSFHQYELSLGLNGFDAVFYALRLSGAAAGWLKLPLIICEIPVLAVFSYLWTARK
jgi:hypothetical protein